MDARTRAVLEAARDALQDLDACGGSDCPPPCRRALAKVRALLDAPEPPRARVYGELLVKAETVGARALIWLEDACDEDGCVAIGECDTLADAERVAADLRAVLARLRP